MGKGGKSQGATPNVDRSRHAEGPGSDEFIRTISFFVIGTLMGAIIWRLEESLSYETEVGGREAELAAQRSALISTVSQEFRTPLSVLLGSSKMLLMREWPEPERGMLEGISGSAPEAQRAHLELRSRRGGGTEAIVTIDRLTSPAKESVNWRKRSRTAAQISNGAFPARLGEPFQAVG